MKFRTAFDAPCRDSDLTCSDPSLTQQHGKDDADINVLLERFKVTGVMPVGVRVPTYDDFSQVTDFRSALDALNLARESFLAMPAEVRSRFQNDPQRFLEYCADPSNLDEMRKLGLAVPAKPDVGVSGAVAPDAKPSGA